MYREIRLFGTCYADLDTEVRFSVADSRACNVELIKFSIPVEGEEKNVTRISNCLVRVMRAMMRAGLIQFFLSAADLGDGSTEAEFLINKYAPHLSDRTESRISYYVKI